jgi:hypothetical protein
MFPLLTPSHRHCSYRLLEIATELSLKPISQNGSLRIKPLDLNNLAQRGTLSPQHGQGRRVRIRRSGLRLRCHREMATGCNVTLLRGENAYNLLIINVHHVHSTIRPKPH